VSRTDRQGVTAHFWYDGGDPSGPRPSTLGLLAGFDASGPVAAYTHGAPGRALQ